MSSYPDITTIIGYSLFAFSEIIPLLPIPANGILHSLAIGITNSFSNTKPNTDAEIAHTLIDTKPQMANVVSTLEGNFRLTDALKLLNSKPQLIPYIEKLAYDKNLHFINSLLVNNPDSINEIKRLIINCLSNQTPQINNINIQQPQPDNNNNLDNIELNNDNIEIQIDS
jgi:hypothetical protein